MRSNKQRGLTLIEVAIAAAILTIAGLALAAALAQGHDLAQTPREEARARHAIRSLLARMAAAPFDEVARDYHGRGFPVEPLRAAPGDADGLPGEIELAYGPDDDRSFYKVTVRVRWSGLRGERTVESVSYLSNARGDTGTPVPLEELAITGEPIDPRFGDLVAEGGA